VFPEANPSKEQLDGAVSDHPAYIESADGHSGWANSKAVALAGITKDTPDSAGGRIARDPVTKQPTGTLRESARELVTSKIPPATAEECYSEYFLPGARRKLRVEGEWTSVFAPGRVSSRCRTIRAQTYIRPKRYSF